MERAGARTIRGMVTKAAASLARPIARHFLWSCLTDAVRRHFLWSCLIADRTQSVGRTHFKVRSVVGKTHFKIRIVVAGSHFKVYLPLLHSEKAVVSVKNDAAIKLGTNPGTRLSCGSLGFSGRL